MSCHPSQDTDLALALSLGDARQILNLRGPIGENGALSSVSFWIRVQERVGTTVVIFRLGGKDVDEGRSDPEL